MGVSKRRRELSAPVVSALSSLSVPLLIAICAVLGYGALVASTAQRMLFEQELILPLQEPLLKSMSRFLPCSFVSIVALVCWLHCAASAVSNPHDEATSLARWALFPMGLVLLQRGLFSTHLATFNGKWMTAHQIGLMAGFLAFLVRCGPKDTASKARNSLYAWVALLPFAWSHVSAYITSDSFSTGYATLGMTRPAAFSDLLRFLTGDLQPAQSGCGGQDELLVAPGTPEPGAFDAGSFFSPSRWLPILLTAAAQFQLYSSVASSWPACPGGFSVPKLLRWFLPLLPVLQACTERGLRYEDLHSGFFFARVVETIALSFPVLFFPACILQVVVLEGTVKLKLQAKVTESEALHNERDRFLAYLVHELRVPFNTLRLGIELMREEIEDAKMSAHHGNGNGNGGASSGVGDHVSRGGCSEEACAAYEHALAQMAAAVDVSPTAAVPATADGDGDGCLLPPFPKPPFDNSEVSSEFLAAPFRDLSPLVHPSPSIPAALLPSAVSSPCAVGRPTAYPSFTNRHRARSACSAIGRRRTLSFPPFAPVTVPPQTAGEEEEDFAAALVPDFTAGGCNEDHTPTSHARREQRGTQQPQHVRFGTTAACTPAAAQQGHGDSAASPGAASSSSSSCFYPAPLFSPACSVVTACTTSTSCNPAPLAHTPASRCGQQCSGARVTEEEEGAANVCLLSSTPSQLRRRAASAPFQALAYASTGTCAPTYPPALHTSVEDLHDTAEAAYEEEDASGDGGHAEETEAGQEVRLEGEREEVEEDEEESGTLALCSAAADNMGRLLDDILTAQKLRSGAFSLLFSRVAIPQVLQEAARMGAFACQEKGAVITTSIQRGFPSRLLTDRQRLLQITANLLSNALKFVRQGRGRIALDLQVQEVREVQQCHVLPSRLLSSGAPTPALPLTPSSSPIACEDGRGQQQQSLVVPRLAVGACEPAVSEAEAQRRLCPQQQQQGAQGGASATPKSSDLRSYFSWCPSSCASSSSQSEGEEEGSGPHPLQPVFPFQLMKGCTYHLDSSLQGLQRMTRGDRSEGLTSLQSTGDGGSPTSEIGSGSCCSSRDSSYSTSNDTRSSSSSSSSSSGAAPASQPAPYRVALVRITVTDNGCGMTAAEHAGLFTPFAQTEAGMKVGSSSGLGLSICRDMVERMGGRIQVASVKGLGTAFAVDLPLRML